MTDDAVLYSERDGVATVVLNRPAARNAINSPLAEGLIAAMLRADGRAGVRVLLLTAVGPAFCAGLDMKEFTQRQAPPPRASEAILLAPTLSKPVIGAVNGPVMTGGLELALGLDLLIASEAARFGDTHATVGILPGGGMTARLPRAVGPRLAADMSYSGRVLDAREALAAGLVSRVVPPRDLDAAAQELASTVAQRDGHILRELKKLYRHSLGGAENEALAYEITERDRRRAAGGQLVPNAGRSTTPAGKDPS